MRQNGYDGVSTRSICDAVGVTAPTLYHHFGDMRSLQDSAVDHAFRSFMARWATNSKSDDPLTRIRRGWDSHIAFSRDEPELYSIVATQNARGKIHSLIVEAHGAVVEDFREIERAHGLNYPPEVAAQILTGNCLGSAIMIALQGQLAIMPDLDELMREQTIRSILGDAYRPPESGRTG